ncbi:MAG TPA: biotin-dependent carboxyltransferase family protein [Gammaproteobacteria bacterium]|nr:biotin-dependent carboxyltransferase family protein [Xanthomonadales bacterium]HOP23320.1 biotin-dependent carboxyltransferase family protein [Gammaproteobacteria bacterium]
MSVEILAPGVYSTIQDQGRFGFRNIGVPVSGFMDKTSAKLANSLLNNELDAAVIETLGMGLKLKFHQRTYISICGAQCDITINQNPVSQNSVLEVRQNDILHFGKVQKGIWCYLSIAGGFQAEVVLSSRSFFQGITKKSKLEKGDRIKTLSSTQPILNRTKVKPQSRSIDNPIEVFKGPEFNSLNSQTQSYIANSSFQVSKAINRMAYKLEKDHKLSAKEIITSPVQPGTVQLTPSGELIVLMQDCQTTGGYARVLQLTEQSLSKLAQIGSGESVEFLLIEF